MNLYGYGQMSYQELKKINYGALDLFPVKDFLKKDMEISDIRSAIEYAIEVEPKCNHQEFWDYMEAHKDFFQDDLFNWMSEDEFVEYCKERFPDIHWHYQLIERYWVN